MAPPPAASRSVATPMGGFMELACQDGLDPPTMTMDGMPPAPVQDDSSTMSADAVLPANVQVDGCSTSTKTPIVQTSYLFVPDCKDELKPAVGMAFDSLEAVENFYRAYADEVGFAVRVGPQLKVHDQIRNKRFLCSKQGFMTKKTSAVSSGKKRNPMQQSKKKRCGCNAHIYVTLGPENKYYIKSMVEQHTHGLVSTNKTIILSSSRSISQRVKPVSDLENHLGDLLDWTDVSFSVGGETFRAHRAVLAARAPVFEAQVFGPMADTRMPCITLPNMQPATFKILLRFMYTDTLPGDEELIRDSSMPVIELIQNVLAAADMYHLDSLKLLCVQKLWEHVSADTVASILCSAELHKCLELKNACIDFFLQEENFKKAVLTEGYSRLMQSSPSVMDEIRKRMGN